MKIRRFFARNKVILILIGIVVLCFLYYIYLHRHPRTDNAFVVANVIPVSALVPGYITDIYVENNQKVNKGDKLFTVYTTPYELALKTLQANLKAAQFNSQALANEIKVKQLSYDATNAQFKNAEYLAQQSLWLLKKQAVAQQNTEILGAQRDEAKAALYIMVAE